MHAFVKYLILASLALLAVALWRKDMLPPPERISEVLADAPSQAETTERPFRIAVQGVDYTVVPRYRYELTGLVVSMHDTSTWWNYVHREWKDYVNVVDLCVVWGDNARRGAYQGIKFGNDQWTCHFSTNSSEVWEVFDQTAASNNHMVTDDAGTARAMRKVRVGDQIRFRGYLADYTTHRPDGAVQGVRKTSTVRDDTGNGACEVVYVQSFDIIQPASRMWVNLAKLAAVLLVASVIGWFWLPYRPAD